MTSERLISHLPLHPIIRVVWKWLYPLYRKQNSGLFIISISHVLKYPHCFAIVDESCTFLSAWHVASPYVDQHSFLARGRAELLKWSGERTGPTLTSLPLAGSLQAEPLLQGALVPSVSCELTFSTGADTSSARTRGGGRPTELKVVTLTPENRDGPFSVHNATRKAAAFAKDGIQPAISSTPLSKASRVVTLLSLKIYSPTSCSQFTNCGSRIGELMTKDSWTKASPCWTV